MPQAEVNGVDIRYRLQGDGPRLLYIPGTAGDLRIRPGVFDSPLAGRYTILSLDQRGLGRSGKPPGPYTMADYAADAAGLLDAVGWEECLVMGWSFGGMVAQELAIRQPERIQRLVLSCCASGGAGGASYPLHQLMDLPEQTRARRWMELADLGRDQTWQREHPDQWRALLEQLLERWALGADEPQRREGLIRQLKARAGHDTWERLASISCPTLVCGGRRDGIARPESLKAMAGAIPGARLALFEGGHAFLDQDPAAWKAVLEFLGERAG